MDYGLAVLAQIASGGKVGNPPWYDTSDDEVQSDDALITSLSKFGKPREVS